MLLARLIPALTVKPISASEDWQLGQIKSPLVCNRDGEEFILNSSSITINEFGNLDILGVVRA